MRAGIALGSNLGDRLRPPAAGVARAAGAAGSGGALSRSRAFTRRRRSAPAPDAGAFLNAVAEVEYPGHPASFWRRCMAIEAKMGRPSKRPRNASRAIDLDLLYAGNLVLANDEVDRPAPAAASAPLRAAAAARSRPGAAPARPGAAPSPSCWPLSETTARRVELLAGPLSS